MNYKITYSNELYHHGIKGQKWGVRRFQNEDGSLTAAGRERKGYKIKMAAKKTISSTGEKIKSTASKVKNWMNDPVNHEKMKKAAKIGLAVAGTALAAYGAYKISEHNSMKLDKEFDAVRSKGYDFVMKQIDRYKAQTDYNDRGSRSELTDAMKRGDISNSFRDTVRRATKRELYVDNPYLDQERSINNKRSKNIYNRIRGRSGGTSTLKGARYSDEQYLNFGNQKWLSLDKSLDIKPKQRSRRQ